MKKLICMMICAALLLGCACAETMAFGSTDQGYAAVASALAGASGYGLNTTDSEASAANAMLADAGTVALMTQQGMINGLEGYTDADLRTDMVPVMMIARDDLYVVCSAQAAQEGGFSDLAGMAQYVNANQYALTLMRGMSASNEDYATVRLAEQLYFEEETFTDEQDVAGNIANGSYVCVVNSRRAKALEAAGNVVLGTLSATAGAAYPEKQTASAAGLETIGGSYLGIFVNKSADAAAVQQALAGAAAADGVKSAIAAASMTAGDGSDFAAQVTSDFAAYKDYMTGEGLFFYEE